MQKYTFRKFNKQDFKEYKNWFQDVLLKTALGSVDGEWLKYILTDTEGTELAVSMKEELICVIGINYPTEAEGSWVITNIAVKPSMRNKGIGSEILAELIKSTRLEEEEFWLAYVDKENIAAQGFFKKNNWIRGIDEDMIKYEYKKL